MSSSAPKLKEVPPAEAAVVPPAKGSKKKKIIIAIIVIVLLGVAGGTAAYFLGQKDPNTKNAKKSAEKVVPAVFLPLDSFTVNLQSENGDKYLQTSITLQLKNEEQINYYKANMPQLRSRVILLLSSKSSDELLTNDGKLKLIDEIIKKVELPYNKGELSPEEVEEHKVLGVDFTSFMIQ